MNKEWVTPKRDDSLKKYLKGLKMKTASESALILQNQKFSPDSKINGIRKLSYQSLSIDSEE
jgi:hypothetical protein